jgi:hypothetical protein
MYMCVTCNKPEKWAAMYIYVLGVTSQESERLCICVLGVTSQESEWPRIFVLSVTSQESER